jgi:hypothetical protein
MRACAHCGTSIEDRRPQAIYCCGGCRAAGSRAKAEERAKAGPTLQPTTKPHRNRTEGICCDEYQLATPTEEQRINLILRRHPDLHQTPSPERAA